jgi:phosphatidylinositol glycan class M
MWRRWRNSLLGIERPVLRALVIRIALVAFSSLLDASLPVRYTDVDYFVFTDAAKHVIEGRSPYLRHTYRYPPILAWILTPNLLIHPAIGKIFFSIADIGVGILIYWLLIAGSFEPNVAVKFAQFWWLNPISIVICTRGSADAITACLVLAALLAVQKNKASLAGSILGIAVHLRLYPIVLAFNFLATCSNNMSRFRLICSSAISFLTLTLISWVCYGKDFIQESYLYHLSRRDAKHNFSSLFYPLYLLGEEGAWLGKLTLALQAVLIMTIAFAFAKRKADVPFACFCSCFVFVAYNKVITAQYFIWFLSILPACAPRLRLTATRTLVLTCLWIVTQVTWLLPAYLLEFQGLDTFLLIWLYSLAFFVVNVFILAELVTCYQPAPPPHTSRPRPRPQRKS